MGFRLLVWRMLKDLIDWQMFKQTRKKHTQTNQRDNNKKKHSCSTISKCLKQSQKTLTANTVFSSATKCGWRVGVGFVFFIVLNAQFFTFQICSHDQKNAMESYWLFCDFHSKSCNIVVCVYFFFGICSIVLWTTIHLGQSCCVLYACWCIITKVK